jgi:hypothetical protein
LRDDLVALTGPTEKFYPVARCRVTALVEVDGERREMIFLTNNVTWSAQTVADLYRCRWSIEVFFKELKQTLQLADFLGHNANAVRWQVWTALLVYLLLRCWAYLSQWGHSFTRLFALVRSALWQKLACSNAVGQPATAVASSARHNRPVCQASLGTADSHPIAKNTKSLNPFCHRDTDSFRISSRSLKVHALLGRDWFLFLILSGFGRFIPVKDLRI